MTMYQQERVWEVRDEITPLLEANYNETEQHKDKFKFNPDFEGYERLDRWGHLILITARRDGKIIGYYCAVISQSLHYKDHLMAGNDTMYILPECRTGRTFLRLVEFMEKTLRQRGVSVTILMDKINHSMGTLEHLGYEPVETKYKKILI